MLPYLEIYLPNTKLQKSILKVTSLKGLNVTFQDLFLHSTGLRRKIYSTPMEKVTDLVAVLYWEPVSIDLE